MGQVKKFHEALNEIGQTITHYEDGLIKESETINKILHELSPFVNVTEHEGRVLFQSNLKDCY